MEFFSAYDQGFARVATATVEVAIADPETNAARILEQARLASDDGVGVLVFPELGLTGYAIDDLLLQDPVLEATDAALAGIVTASTELLPVLVVGAPLRKGNRLYNCAIAVHRGAVLGVAPKSYLPNYREFYEKRHFASGADQHGEQIEVCGDVVPFGPDLIFEAADLAGLALHVEICEDLWVPITPASVAALAGATVIANLSGSPINIGKARERHTLAAEASSRLICAYAYASAGEGESTTDLAWDGQTMIHELGALLAESQRFPTGPRSSVADVDLRAIAADRLRNGSFDDNRAAHTHLVAGIRRVQFTLDPPRTDIGLRRAVDRFPFVPDDADKLALDCYEAYSIQVSGLGRRLAAIGQPAVVMGVSGGLDSTQALLVAARAMDRQGRPRSDILTFTLPGFATSEHTKHNAVALSRALGTTFEEIDIRPAARQMLVDIGHPFAAGEEVYDVTFENVQAGLRTDYLFRLANARGGIVLGTGDLSELALGWCTYGVGDHMSHYTVNSGVPKTLIQHLIRWVISSETFDESVGEVLQSILDTEITPELVPAGESGLQSTQEQIGPYELQDFHLHYVLRYGFAPSRIGFLAWHAWHDASAGAWPPGFPDDERRAYDLGEIRGWLRLFLQRFFGFSQFKRSALPNGPKVSTGGAVSPRGDWRAPSDGNATVWLAELDANVPTPPGTPSR